MRRLNIYKKKILNNYHALVNKTSKKIILVLKSNAYGIGYQTLFNILEDKVDMIAFGNYEESKNISTNKDKLIFGIVDELDNLESNIVLTVDSIKTFEKYKDILKKNKFHIQLDVGMNRKGFKNFEDAREIISYSISNNLLLDGIFAHLNDSNNDDKSKIQINSFDEFVNSYDTNTFDKVHLFASASSMKFPESKLHTHIRPAEIFSLGNPNYNLGNVFNFEANVVEIKDVKKDEIIGYGSKFIANDDCKIAIIDIGYAELNIFNNGIPITIKINNKEFSTIGKFTMNYIFASVDDTVNINDSVIIFDDIFKTLNELKVEPYHIISSLGNNIERNVIDE